VFHFLNVTMMIYLLNNTIKYVTFAKVINNKLASKIVINNKLASKIVINNKLASKIVINNKLASKIVFWTAEPQF